MKFRNEIATSAYTSIRVTRGRAGFAPEKKLQTRPPEPYKAKTVNHAVIALRRCWNWGIENDYLPPKDPFAKLPMLHSEGRQRIVTNQEFQALLRHCTDALFYAGKLRKTSRRPA